MKDPRSQIVELEKPFFYFCLIVKTNRRVLGVRTSMFQHYLKVTILKAFLTIAVVQNFIWPNELNRRRTYIVPSI